MILKCNHFEYVRRKKKYDFLTVNFFPLAEELANTFEIAKAKCFFTTEQILVSQFSSKEI